MPMIMPPLGPFYGSSPEVPNTRRFPAYAMLLVGSRVDSSNLQASAEVTSGEGVLAICDVISSVIDEAR